MCWWIRCAVARQPGTGFGSTCSTCPRNSDPPRPEHLLQLVSGCDFELVVTAVAGLFVGPPAQKHGRVAEAVPFHVIVLPFADPLYPARLPEQILPLAPAALAPRHAPRPRL